MVGYRPVRVYNCNDCGAHLAMDSLPSHLITRMYPLPDKVTLYDNVTTPVDFCVVFGGKNAELLARMFFYSLNHVTSTFKGVNFHFVNRDLNTDEFNRICSIVSNYKIYNRSPIPSCMIKKWSKRKFTIPQDQMILDTEWSCQFVSEYCGTEKFFILSHFDIFFIGDFINYLRSKVTDNTGMLGQHCPFMLVNRDALRKSHFKFRGESQPFFIQPLENEPKQFHLYYKGDKRIKENALQTGFDNGELLELEMNVIGYDTDPLREEFDNFFYHFTGGDRVISGDEFVSIQDRAMMFIDGYKIPNQPVLNTNK